MVIKCFGHQFLFWPHTLGGIISNSISSRFWAIYISIHSSFIAIAKTRCIATHIESTYSISISRYRLSSRFFCLLCWSSTISSISSSRANNTDLPLLLLLSACLLFFFSTSFIFQPSGPDPEALHLSLFQPFPFSTSPSFFYVIRSGNWQNPFQ